MKTKANYFGFLLLLLIAIGYQSCTNTRQSNDKGGIVGIDSSLFRFESQIEAFEAADQLEFPGKGIVVFTGSSSIRMWDSLGIDMAPLPVVNRGFGGAKIPEVTFFTERIVFPYAPRVIVLYCGENDIANDETPYTQPVESFKTWLKKVREKFPRTKIIYLSMKPSPRRWNYWEKCKKADALIEACIRKEENVEFVDIGTSMLDDNQQVRRDIFLPDSLHMNLKGYEIWTSILKPKVEAAYIEK